MKKILFYLLVLLALWLVIGTQFLNIAIDIDSKMRVWKKGIWIIIPAALLVTAGFIIFYRKAFPKHWATRSKRSQVGIGIVMLVLCVGVTIAGTITMDVMLPYKKKEQLGGVVVTKYFKKSNRSKDYILRILFLHAGGSREFIVRRSVYDKMSPGDNINSIFYTGPFGTVYTRIQ
jgi:hypothetical protein